MNNQDIESLSSQLNQWGNFNSGILYLVKSICTMNNWPYGEIWQGDKNDEFMVWTGFWTKKENYFEKLSKFSSLHKFAKGVGLIGKTWEQKKLIWIEEFLGTDDFLRSEIASIRDLGAAVCIPILHEQKILCLLCFFLKRPTSDDKKSAEILFTSSEVIGKVLTGLS